MRVFYITTEEPFHLPVFFDTIFRARRSEIVGVAIVRALYKGQTWFSQSKRFIRAFGLKTFLQEALLFALFRALDSISKVMRLSRFYSVKSAAQHYALPVFEPEDINAPSFLTTVRELAPDVIVSVSNPQIFRDELISIPSWGCINNHGSLLPKYRGVLPSFWMLANDEKKAGVTVHYLNEGIDDGMIIIQKEFDILPDDTLHTLITRSKRLGAEALLEALDQIAANQVSARPNRIEEGSYYSWPTREAVERFRKLGRRFR
jgi:methionyl-tRNA formyltransferase